MGGGRYQGFKDVPKFYNICYVLTSNVKPQGAHIVPV